MTNKKNCLLTRRDPSHAELQWISASVDQDVLRSCSSAIYRNVSLAALFCGHPESGAQFFTLVITEPFSLFVVIISIKLWFGVSVQLLHQVGAKVTGCIAALFCST